METVIILTHTKLDYDSRIQKQIRQVAAGYLVIVCCRRGMGIAENRLPGNVDYVYYEEGIGYVGRTLMEKYLESDQKERGKMEKALAEYHITLDGMTIYEMFRTDLHSLYRQVIKKIRLEERRVKGIICNDVFVLAAGCRIYNELKMRQPGIKFIGDMHEVHFDYAPVSDCFGQKVRTWLCDRYLLHCNLVLCVSDWIAQLYRERYQKLNVIVVRNVSEYYKLRPKKRLQIGNPKVRLVHAGAAQKGRRIESMIHLMDYLDTRYTLDFYLVSHTPEECQYIRSLKELIVEKCLEKRVRILEPVPQEQLIRKMHAYDIGVYYIAPIYHNHRYLLPNKLFEYLQARIAIVATPLKSMKEMIETYKIGKVSEEFTFESFARTIGVVAENLDYYKEHANDAAEELCFEREFSIVLAYLDDTIREVGRRDN